MLILHRLFFCCFCLILNTVAQGQMIDRGLRIGDVMPDVEIDKIINFGKTNGKISDFKGKALLLDFWGTFCGDCVVAFPKLDSLQKRFNDELQILPISGESENSVKQLLKSIKKIKNLNVTSVVEDTIISALFYHRYVPHYVWIDAKGVIQAITGKEEISNDNIQDLVSGKKMTLPYKNDALLQYNEAKPLFYANQFGIDQDEMLYRSTITKYKQNLPAVTTARKGWIDCVNKTIKSLYKLAVGKFGIPFQNDNRVILEGFKDEMDSIMIGVFRYGQRKNLYKIYKPEISYCYELILPDTNYTRAQQFDIMQRDLNNYFSKFGISGRMEKRPRKILALVRTSDDDKISAKGGKRKDFYSNYILDIQNLPMFFFIIKFQAFYTTEGSLPIVDKTGYSGNINIQINADLSNIATVNEELKKYDLKFVEKEEILDMIIITKKTDTK